MKARCTATDVEVTEECDGHTVRALVPFSDPTIVLLHASPGSPKELHTDVSDIAFDLADWIAAGIRRRKHA